LVLTLVLLATGSWAIDRGADGKFEKRTSSHFVLYQDVDIDGSSGLRGSRRFEQQVLKVLESGYDSLDDFLGLRPSRPITVVVHDSALFDRQFAGLFRFPAAGFYQGKVHVRGDVVVHERLVRTLHHELVHAAFHAEAPSFVLPAWLNEGVAEWFEARTLGKRQLSDREARYMQIMASEGSLFSLGEMSSQSFGGFGPNAAQLAYIESYAFIEFLTRREGERALREFCREFMRVHDLDRASKRAFRVDLGRLEEDFLSELYHSSGL